jgi:hypothetical protein
MHLLLGTALIGVTLFAIEQATAACLTTPVRYHFRNETVVSNAVVDSSGSCIHRRGAGARAQFTDYAVVERPRHGSLTQSGRFTVVYRPAAGFRGQDTYAIRICGMSGGTSDRRSGCSTIRYSTTVR